VLWPAFAGGDLFHYSGDFSSHIAIRNAYAETQNLGFDGLSLWAGSRMYRGDDIYLFDYWPLDNLNTIGAGARYERHKFDIALHAGLNRLDDLYQYETLDTPPRGLGPDILAADPGSERGQVQRRQACKAGRDGELAQRRLAEVRDAAGGSGNLLPPLRQALKDRCSLGEVCGAMREVFGEYKPSF